MTEELWEHTNVVLHLGPSLPPLEPRQFGILFLRTRDVVQVWSGSDTVRTKVFQAWPEPPGQLWDQWRLHADDENEWRLVAEHACPEVLPMFDARMLFSTGYLAVHVTTVAWAVLRRLQPIGVGRPAEWRSAICHEHQVTQVLCLPVSTTRFAALYEAGSWAGVPAACRYGCVVGTTLYLPKDATAAVCTHAVADLFDVSIQGRPEEGCIVLPGGGRILTEAAPVCAPDAARLQAYEPKIRVDPDLQCPVVVLERVDQQRDARRAVSLDLAVVGRHCDVSRLGPDALGATLPALYRRAGKSVPAWTREAQMRRLCSEWTLEGMEQGCNLSSLGLSVLLGLGWRLACGVDAKVLVCPVTRAAMVLVDDVVVIDPTRTTVNFFDLHHYHPPSSHVAPKAGVFVEVRKCTKWHLAWVDSVSSFGTMSVTFVETKTSATLALGTHPWRRISDDSAVTDGLLRRLLFAKRSSGTL